MIDNERQRQEVEQETAEKIKKLEAENEKLKALLKKVKKDDKVEDMVCGDEVYEEDQHEEVQEEDMFAVEDNNNAKKRVRFAKTLVDDGDYVPASEVLDD